MDHYNNCAASPGAPFGPNREMLRDHRRPAQGAHNSSVQFQPHQPPNYTYPYHQPPPVSPAQNADPRLGHGQLPSSTSYNTQGSRCPTKSEDEEWLKSWLATIQKAKAVQNDTQGRPRKRENAQRDLPIHEARLCLKNCLTILDKLTQTQHELQQHVETMSSSEWKRKTIEIGALKDEFTQAVSKFSTGQVMTGLRRAVDGRRKKRATIKRRKARLRRDRALEAECLQKADKDADMWIESMKDEVERAKMEEHFKMDADCILAEVTKKKGDAKKQLTLLQALIKLRAVREQAAIQRGEKVSLEDRQTFETSTSKLVGMWQEMLRVYTKEEQGLRLMLEQTASEDNRAARTAKENAVTREWHTLLFGPRCPPPRDNTIYWALTAAERDLETFVAIRRSWDTFLVPPSEESGSNIPIGWVIPEANADKWNRYLVR